MAKNKKEDYVVYNSSIDEFIKIKNLPSRKVESLIGKVASLLSANKTRIKDYVEFIVDELVYSPKKFSSKDRDEILDSLFEGVVEVYPIFQIDTICEVINQHSKVEERKVKANTSKGVSSLKGLNSLKKNIESKVIGQNGAIEEVVNVLKLRVAGFSQFVSFFFIGPTGVGKTELAKTVASEYLSSNKKLLKINCGEYSNPHEYAKLIGSPPGYIGFNEKGILTEKAGKSSEWVILFDEIEKASEKLHNLLLGFLDDGVIQDNHGTELDFSNSLVVFTSNIGMEHLGKKYMGFDAKVPSYDDVKEVIMDTFKGKFPPEFVNRIDSIIHFNELTKEDAAKIVRLNIKGLPIQVTKKLIDYVVEGGYSKEYGARNLKRFIVKNVTLKLAEEMLKGPKYNRYKPRFKGGELTLEGEPNED